MEGTSSYRVALRALGLAAVMAAAPLAVSPLLAQQGRIQATAFVIGPVQSFGLRPDTAPPAPRPEVRRWHIPGVGVLDVDSGPGAVTRLAVVADRPVRIEIDYVGN